MINNQNQSIGPQLFGDPGAPAKSRRGGRREGAGRPKGAQAIAAQQLRAFLIQRTGTDALVEGYATVAGVLRSIARNTDGKGVDPALKRFAEQIGCEGKSALAFDRLMALAREVFPSVYPKLASVELQAPGAPNSGTLAPVEGELPVLDGEFQRIEPI